MAQRRTNPDFINGVPELLVLRLLARRPMHGYELVSSIRLATEEKLSFNEGSIYPVLHKLEGDGLVSGEKQLHKGRQRVVYSITEKGSKRFKASAENWLRITQAIQHVLGDHFDAQPA